MFTSIDKALVALVMSGVYLVNHFSPYHFELDQDSVSAIVAAITPVLIYFVPNKDA